MRKLFHYYKNNKTIINWGVVLLILTNGFIFFSALYGHRYVAKLDRQRYLHFIDDRPVYPVASCKKAIYEGATTAFYSDRTYHTEKDLQAIKGLSFCFLGRHEKAFWLMDVLRPTTIYMLGTEKHNFVEKEWRKLPLPVTVKARGITLDRLYEKKFEPGRYILKSMPLPNGYPFSRTVLPTFWNDEDVRVTGNHPTSQ